MSVSFHDAVHGCLTGAVLGAQFAFTRSIKPEKFALAQPADVFSLPLELSDEQPSNPLCVWTHSLLPVVHVGVKAYLAKGSRVTPENFADIFQHDAGIATPSFSFDALHSTQELLQEGMHPRLSGFGAAPSGFIAAAMPAVGIFHAGNPEYAYLDGVELASVAQGRLGADWAGLCAAAVAAAFTVGATPESVATVTLDIARENNPLVHEHLQRVYDSAQRLSASSREAFVAWWLADAGCGGTRRCTQLGGLQSNSIRIATASLLQRGCPAVAGAHYLP